MKLNPDCIRDVLLYLEENLVIKDRNKLSVISLNQLKENLSQYDEDDIFYSVYNLYQIRYMTFICFPMRLIRKRIWKQL